jgi:cell division protein ZipA
MMQHFQSILIVVGVMAIVSVLIHGYLLSRKEKTTALEFESDVDVLIEPSSNLSQAEMTNSDLSVSNEDETSEEDYIDFSNALSEVNDDNEVIFLDGEKGIRDTNDDVFNSETIKENIISFNFDKSKNKNKVTDNIADLVLKEKSTDQVSHQTPLKTSSAVKESENKDNNKEQIPDVFILNVVAKEDATIGGLQLLQFFLTSGFRYGEMSLFHRHLHSDGTGPILFSIANMMAPGTFDPHHMEKFNTQGVSFFITAPNQEINIQEAFEMMLTAVEQLSKEFDCIVLNAQREPLTEQQFRSYHERLMRYV